MTPLTVKQMRDVLEWLPDEAVVDVKMDNITGFAVKTRVDIDFNDNLLLSIEAISDIKDHVPN